MDGNKSEKNKKPSSSGTPRIMTMDAIRNSNEDSERQAYFAGGSEHSGQQILGRGKRSNEDLDSAYEASEALAAVFRRVSSNSSVGDPRTVSFQGASRSFSGTGHRLGDTESTDDSEDLTSSIDPDETPMHVVLTLWENGYSFDDGPLHSYDDPGCADLVANIERGELPPNLLPVERDGSLRLVSVVDKRTQKYRERMKVFGGKGHILGSPTPSLSQGSSEAGDSGNEGGPHGGMRRSNLSSSSSSNGDVIMEDDEDASRSSGDIEFIRPISTRMPGGPGHVLQSDYSPNLNSRLPNLNHPVLPEQIDYTVQGSTDFSHGHSTSTMLKIRLPSGQTIQLKVSSSSTISQIKELVTKCIPGLAAVIFSLQLTYPRRDLQDDEKIDSASIKNSVLALRV